MVRVLRESCHIDLLTRIPFLMESVREAASGCWPTSLEVSQDWRVRGFGMLPADRYGVWQFRAFEDFSIYTEARYGAC